MSGHQLQKVARRCREADPAGRAESSEGARRLLYDLGADRELAVRAGSRTTSPSAATWSSRIGRGRSRSRCVPPSTRRIPCGNVLADAAAVSDTSTCAASARTSMRGPGGAPRGRHPARRRRCRCSGPRTGWPRLLTSSSISVCGSTSRRRSATTTSTSTATSSQTSETTARPTRSWRF